MRSELLQETDMTKMNLEQANELILRRRKDDGKSWEEIAEELQKKGYRNNQGNPMPASTVRFRFYNMSQVAKKTGANSRTDQQLSMIKRMLELDVDDKSKVKLIASVLEFDNKT